MNRLFTAIVGLLVFGAARLPFEHALMKEHRAALFHSSELNLDLREQIGQGGFIAALSGFRSIEQLMLGLCAARGGSTAESHIRRMARTLPFIRSTRKRGIITKDHTMSARTVRYVYAIASVVLASTAMGCARPQCPQQVVHADRRSRVSRRARSASVRHPPRSSCSTFGRLQAAKRSAMSCHVPRRTATLVR